MEKPVHSITDMSEVDISTYPFLLCEFLEELKIPTWLVLINFTDDSSYKSTTISEWLKHYNIIISKMGIKEGCNLLDKIIMVFTPAL
jgi:hypothetical protein